MIKALLFDFYGVLYVQRKLVFTNRLELNRVLLDFSQTLKSQYKIGLLSNMNSGVMGKYFTQDELHNYFDKIIISGDVGMVKPQPGIYKLAAKTMNLDVSQCLLIDDSQVNCDGAKAAGMQALLYNSTEQVKRDLAQLLAAQ